METAYRVSPTPKALSIQRLYFGANIIHGFGVMLCGPIFYWGCYLFSTPSKTLENP